MLKFFEKIKHLRESEEEKSPERKAYEQKRAELKAEIRHLNREYNLLIPNHPVNSYYSMWMMPALSSGSSYNDTPGARERRMRIQERLSSCEQDLKALRDEAKLHNKYRPQPLQIQATR